MATQAKGVVSELLEEVARGSQDAKNKLFEHVYDELRRRARYKMARERVGHTWGSTGLVNEVFLRLGNDGGVFTQDSAFFFKKAERMMHDLLRTHWRRRQARLKAEANAALDEMAEAVRSTFNLELDELLKALEALKATGKNGLRRYEVVRLRLWDGLTYDQCAQKLGVVTATAQRDWWAARAWLRRRLDGGTP